MSSRLEKLIRCGSFSSARSDMWELDWHDYVKIDPRYYRPTEVDLLIGDASKAKRTLGWEPKVSSTN